MAKKPVSKAISDSRKDALPKGPTMRRKSSKASYKGKGLMSVAAADRVDAEQIRINAFNSEKKKKK